MGPIIKSQLSGLDCFYPVFDHKFTGPKYLSTQNDFSFFKAIIADSSIHLLTSMIYNNRSI